MSTSSSAFVVGACVQQDGTQAEIVDCGVPGAYKITQLVDDEAQCPDPTQPSLLLTDAAKSRVACLGPS